MADVLYIFPDTNLFIQCKPLDELDWARWKDFAEIHLLVSRPVQAEIDVQKDRGNGRVGKRARTTSALFREVINAANDYKIIQADGPCVKLFLRNDLRPDPSLGDVLNYSERDDQLVGVARTFSKLQSNCEVRVLTHDTGPMATAKMVGLAFEPIPDDWLLPPEPSATERKIAVLENELQRLKNEGPQFRISFRSGEGHILERWDATIIHYPKLSRQEIDALAQRLQDRFPMETEFKSSITLPRGNVIAAVLFAAAQPPSDDQIRAYKREAYPNWVGRCKRVLSKYHRRLRKKNDTEQFEFLISNHGLKPAKDALVTIRAQGNFLIRAPFEDERESEFSLPPEPPRNAWDGFAVAAEYLNAFNRTGSPIPLRDPNGFFWKDRSEKPSENLNLECEQWRHDMPDENFTGNVEPTDRDIVGALTCEVRAENLGQTATATVPLRLKVTKGDTYGLAMKEIDGMELLPRVEVF